MSATKTKSTTDANIRLYESVAKIKAELREQIRRELTGITSGSTHDIDVSDDRVIPFHEEKAASG